MDRAPLDPEIEDGLWQMCDYSSLTNSTRSPPPVKKETAYDLADSVPQSFAEIESTAKMTQVAQTPDFESLYQGALSLDYSLLDDGMMHDVYAPPFINH